MNTPELAVPPWHAPLFDHMSQAINDDRVSHGLLICGPPGVGKRVFADRVLRALLCRERASSGDACGTCSACRQVKASTHPDISRLMPEETGRQIKVEQVRTFSRRLYLTPQYNSGRLGWIDPADQLSPSAANSLLKTLEEPPRSCHLLLLTSHVSALMATVRSRCQLWRVPPPTPSVAREWLEGQGVDTAGLDADSLRSPFSVLAQRQQGYDEQARAWDETLSAVIRNREDVSSAAERMAKQPADLWLDWMYRRSSSLMSLALGDDSDQSLAEPLAQVARKLDPAVFQPWLACVADASRLSRTNADWQLVIESLLLELKVCLKRRSAAS